MEPTEPLADEQPADPPPTPIQIPSVELTPGLAGFAATDVNGSPTLDDVAWTQAESFLRGRWYVRPVAGYERFEGASAVRVGASGGRMWFTTGGLPIQGGADIGVAATGSVGAAAGGRLHAHATAGPWLGPIGLRLGPTLRWDRQSWTDSVDTLEAALLVGARATLSLDVGPVAPYVSVEPSWVAAGDRAGAPVSDETWLGAGVSCQLGWLTAGAHVTRLTTSIGDIFGAGLSVAIRAPQQRGDE